MTPAFPATRWSQVLAAGSADDATARAALSWLCERQWQPLCALAQRWGLDAAAAEDATQDFCCRLIERRVALGALDPAAGPFRAWLLTVFRNFLRDRHAAAQAGRRGGGRQRRDDHLAEVAAPATEPAFDRDWARTLLAHAGDRLAREAEAAGDRRFAHLRPYLLSNPAPGVHAALAASLGQSEGALKVALHRWRQRLHQALRQEVAETLATPTSQAIDDELAALLAAMGGE